MKGLKKKDLDKFQKLGYEDKKKLIDKIPSKLLIPLYLNYCSPLQLRQLVEEWDRIILNPEIVGDGDLDAVRLKYQKKLILLLKGLKKQRLLYLLDSEVLSRYGF